MRIKLPWYPIFRFFRNLRHIDPSYEVTFHHVKSYFFHHGDYWLSPCT